MLLLKQLKYDALPLVISQNNATSKQRPLLSPSLTFPSLYGYSDSSGVAILYSIALG